MKSDTLTTTPWVLHDNLRTRVRYGMVKLDGNKLPYFSITCETEVRKRNGRWYEYSCGANHDTIERVFPHLAPLVKWHLCDQDGTPMHYVANAVFWYEMALGVRERGGYDSDPLGNFKKCAVWGALETDDLLDLLAVEPAGRRGVSDMRRHLEHRLSALHVAFRHDMEQASVTFILPSRHAS